MPEHVITLRLSEAEHRKLRLAAIRYNDSLSGVLRRVIWGDSLLSIREAFHAERELPPNWESRPDSELRQLVRDQRRAQLASTNREVV